MATGYTIEVLNGNAKTLEDFAKVCLMGFGATSHMKEEPISTPYRVMEVDANNKKEERKLKKRLKEFKLISDEQIYEDERNALTKSREHFADKKVKAKEARLKVEKLLREAQLWTPPSKKHKVMKDFMIKELKNTLDFDCDLKPIDTLLEDIDGRLATIDVESIKENHIKQLEQKIDYHKQTHQGDIDHCNESNLWVSDLLDSFKLKSV